MGTLGLKNITAGHYMFFAWPNDPDLEYLNPEVIRKYESFAQAVTVHGNETTSVTAQPIRLE